MSQSPARGNPARRRGQRIRSPAGRRLGNSFGSDPVVSRYEAPEEAFVSSAMRSWFSFGKMETKQDARVIAPRRAVKGQRARSWTQVLGTGIAVSEATPELVRKDRKRGPRSFGSADPRLRTPAYPSLGAVGTGSNAGPHFRLGERRAKGGQTLRKCGPKFSIVQLAVSRQPPSASASLQPPAPSVGRPPQAACRQPLVRHRARLLPCRQARPPIVCAAPAHRYVQFCRAEAPAACAAPARVRALRSRWR